MNVTDITYGAQRIGDTEVFYRAAGPSDAPVVLLLHGFPSASHMFRDLIPELAGLYRVIAPDLPGFGQTRAPHRDRFAYTFDHLTEIVGGFVKALSLSSYALYIFDYGAPVGLRLALKHPERVTAIVSQNGNAYEEGLSANWGPWRDYWANPSDETRAACRGSLDAASIRDDQ